MIERILFVNFKEKSLREQFSSNISLMVCAGMNTKNSSPPSLEMVILLSDKGI